MDGSTADPSLVTVNGQGVTENAQDEFMANVPPQAGTTQTPVTVVAVDETNGTVDAAVGTLNNQAALNYDANGNLLQDDQKSYQWDGENRLSQVAYLSPPPDGPSTIQMTYDGLGRRVGILELDSSGNSLTAKTFVWCGNTLCQERDGTGKVVTKRFFPQGEQIGPKNYYFTKDHLGSIREVTDSTATVITQYDYDPFGNQQQLSGGAVAADFGFTGFHQESAAGLDLTKYRAYDPSKGKWLSRDPMGEGTGPNLYAYAGNSPFNGTDPMGLAVGDTYGEEAAQWYADQYVATGNWLDLVGGVLASLYTPETSNKTLTVLTLGLGAGGREIKFDDDFRAAPLGNRTMGKPQSNKTPPWMRELPHYHRRGAPDESGEAPPGQGIGRHRPWESSQHDKSFWDRF